MKALLSLVLVIVLGVALAACKDPDKRVAVGAKDYHTLPVGTGVSWPSSGTSNGAGCVPAPGNSVSC